VYVNKVTLYLHTYQTLQQYSRTEKGLTKSTTPCAPTTANILRLL